MAEVTIDIDGKVTIDDFFISQEIVMGSLKGSSLSQYLKVKIPDGILD